MEDNNITMSNGNEVCINTTGDCSTCAIPKIGTCNHDRYRDYLNKKDAGEVSAYAFTTPNDVLNIILKVNPEKLVGKSYKEMTELLARAVINSNVSIEGERPFLMEPGHFYNVNKDAIIKRASVDEFDGLIVALDVPFVETDTPSLDSITAPVFDEEEDDDIIGLSVYQFTRSYHVFPDDLDFSLSEEMYIGYEPNELVLVKTHNDNGQVIYYCDAVDVILTTEQLMNSTITGSDDGLTRLYIKPENN